MGDIESFLTKTADMIKEKVAKAWSWVTGSEVSVSIQSFTLSGGLIVVNLVYWPFWVLEKLSGGITKVLKYPREKLSALVKSRTAKIG